ncbi:hypothetical protein ACHAXA_006203, partial [Cyclostephanos tholiformis]
VETNPHDVRGSLWIWMNAKIPAFGRSGFISMVFYNTHSKVSHYVLRHTSHRLRSAVEHMALGLAVCGFCLVILSHRTFVHREDIASIARNEDGMMADTSSSSSSCGAASRNFEYMGLIGEGRGVSVFSILVQLIRGILMRYHNLSNGNDMNLTSHSSWSMPGKKIPGTCLKKITGFREDADVNHILLRYEDINDDGGGVGHSRAFTIYRGHNLEEQIVSGVPTDDSADGPFHSCAIIVHPLEQSSQRPVRFGFAAREVMKRECSHDLTSFLSHLGYLTVQSNVGPPSSKQQIHGHANNMRHRQYSPIVYSYSHTQGLLRLQPHLKHAHNISTQFIIASSSDPNCFGEPFAQTIVFRLVGPDTVILNWILGLQHSISRPRFLYHWKTRKELDLDVYDMDHYAFSSKAGGGDKFGGISCDSTQYESTTSSWPFTSIYRILLRIQRYPLYRLLRFLTFKLLVLLSTLLIFFLTTSLVSFTFQETQDRMLEFTLHLQTRVRSGMPLGGLILDHVLENLVFVPIMVGMIFFLIEFYGGDKFLAFMVLSMVWICEVFSAVSIRSAQGMHFFPRVFFLYFTLFHVYFFSCPIGFTYASLASTILFLFHTMLFFWNRYELPALHAGLITPQSPRMARLGMDRGRVEGEENNVVVSPPRIRPLSLQFPNLDDDRSSITAPTAPLSDLVEFTPRSDTQSLLLHSYPGPMRSYVAAASTSLQSIRSMASFQSLTSLAGGRTSPNFIFEGGYNFTDHSGGVGDDSEEDSYTQRIMSSQ